MVSDVGRIAIGFSRKELPLLVTHATYFVPSKRGMMSVRKVADIDGVHSGIQLTNLGSKAL